MRKLASRFLALAGISMLALILTGILPIVPSSATAEGADVVRYEGGCVFFDANGTPWVDPAATIQYVVTNNGRGNRNVTCHGELPAGATLPTSAMQWDQSNTGFTCLGGDDWSGVSISSGNASFTCHQPI